MGPHRILGRGRWTALRQGDWKFVEDAEGGEYLFDIREDPHEKTNLARMQEAALKNLRQRRNELAKQYAR